MNLIQKFHDGFRKYGRNKAFSHDEQAYSYSEFLSAINGSRNLLEQQSGFKAQQPVGVLCDEKVWTYASIFAIWFSGGVFVPLNPDLPAKLLEERIRKNNIRFIFTTHSLPERMDPGEVTFLRNENITGNEALPLYDWRSHDRLYVLTTSGSTGVPKTVPISLKNVEAFVEGFLEVYPDLTEADNFLQTYDLTADASLTGYLIPFLLGATVYTVSKGGVKPFEVAKVMTRQPISWIQVTPSLLACLRPFFNSFNLGHIRHFHFGGEALPAGLVEEWRKHIPNAEISNVYGPTETTITATIYRCNHGDRIKSRKNIVSIGKPLKNAEVYIQKEAGEKYGELYIAGPQVMEGYIFTSDQPFKHMDTDSRKYYPTGDFVEIDDDGLLFYFGRRDEQVKISGYRVDLIEVENAIRTVVPHAGNLAATTTVQASGMQQLVVFIENYPGNVNEILQKLYPVLPRYMVPEKIIGVEKFPMTSAGKTNKQALVSDYQKKID